MKVFKIILQAFCVLAVILSVSVAAPDNRAVAKKKAQEAQSRAKLSASRNADRVQLSNEQVKEIEKGQAAIQNVEHTKIASAPSGSTAAGKKLYNACGVCHGSNGKKTAPGQIEGRTILNRGYEDLVRELIAYREGTADNGGLEVIMTANMEGWSDQEIQEVSKYIMDLVAKNVKKSSNADSNKSVSADTNTVAEPNVSSASNNPTPTVTRSTSNRVPTTTRRPATRR